jgi:peptidoglycan/LPS O-acetylase OafA/YrhL
MSGETRFLQQIHYFRAFAIVNIVFAHAWGIPEVYKEVQNTAFEGIYIARAIIFHGSTLYFLLISGFLFYYLSPKFSLKRYYRNKLFNVIAPYICMTSLVLIVLTDAFIPPASTLFDSFKKIIEVFICGKAQTQYWYMPFIALIFVISPLLLKIPKKIFFKITVIASLLPLLGSRTGINVSVGQYLYFFPVYLQGMCIAMDYSGFIALINRRKKAFIAVAILSSIGLLCLQGKGYYVSLINITESLYYLQKLSIAFLIMIAFEKLEHKNIPLLNNLATYSFAIFFTHLLIGNSYVKKYYYHLFADSPFLIYPASIVYVVIVVCATLFICMGIKKILGKQSRYLIGV